MAQQIQLNYLRPARYLFCEGTAWYSFGPMPLYKAVLEAVGKYRTNHEPCVVCDEISLVGIDAILAVRSRADFPVFIARANQLTDEDSSAA